MSKEKSVHVVPSPSGGWSVLKSGSTRASRKFVTKEEAIDWGRSHSRSTGTELFIHRYDGTVQEKVANRAEALKVRNGQSNSQPAGTNGRGRG